MPGGPNRFKIDLPQTGSAPTNWDLYETTRELDCQQVMTVPVHDGRAEIDLPAEAVFTLVGKLQAQPCWSAAAKLPPSSPQFQGGSIASTASRALRQRAVRFILRPSSIRVLRALLLTVTSLCPLPGPACALKRHFVRFVSRFSCARMRSFCAICLGDFVCFQ